MSMHCLICAGNDVTLIANNHIFPELYGKFSYLRCNSCHHIKVLPPHANSDVGQEYVRRNVVSSGKTPRAIRRRVSAAIATTNANKSGAPSRIACDIGSGSCTHTQAFEEFGWQGYAVDIECMNPRYPRFIFVENLSEFSKANPVRLFYSNHCLEHIDQLDLETLLEVMMEPIKAGANAYFVVPRAKNSLISDGIYLEEFVFGHKNLFSERSARIFFSTIFPSASGFVVEVKLLRSRLAFIRSRGRVLFSYLSRGDMHKTAKLATYLASTLLFGAEEEICITVRSTLS